MTASNVTPPSTRQNLSAAMDTDLTLSQAAKCLAQKASQKKAPLPPKRTSSFRDQMQQPPPGHFKDVSRSQLTAAGDEWCLITSMTDSIDMSNVTNESLSDHHRSQSSSDDLLSTPASQSRNGSLERILEHCKSPANSPRSTSHDQSYGPNSPAQSNEQKTPETDISDMSLPPPPAALLEDFNPDLPRIARAVPPCAIADQQLLSQLRQSLKKTTTKKSKQNRDNDNVDSGHSSPCGGLTASTREAVAGYRTLPRESGSRQAAQDELVQALVRRTSDNNRSVGFGKVMTSSSENRLSESCSNLSEMVLQMPTPEVRRKVEEWQAGVERSLGELESPSVGRDVNAEASQAFRPERLRSSQRKFDSSAAVTGPQLCIANYMMKPGVQRTASPVVAEVSDDVPVPPLHRFGRSHDTNRQDLVECSKPPEKMPVQSDKQKLKLSKRKPLPDDHSSKGPSSSTIQSPAANNHHLPTTSRPSTWLERAPASPITGGVACLPSGGANDGVRKRYTTQGGKDNPYSGPAEVFSRPMDPAAGVDLKPRAKPRKSLDTQAKNVDRADTVLGLSSLKKGDIKKLDHVRQRSLENETAAQECPKSPKLFSSKVLKDGAAPDGQKPVPAGMKPALPGFKPTQPAPLVAPQQLVARASLHHVSPEKEKGEEADTEPVTKETVGRMTQSLSLSLDVLNSSETRHSSSVLMHLSDEVNTLHRVCSSYVESLPPHGKFQFREILSLLETVAEGLKTGSGGGAKEYDRLLVTLQNCLRGIEGALKR